MKLSTPILNLFLIFPNIYGNYLDKFNRKPSLIFSKEIQTFRHDIQVFQEKSLELLDNSFWIFYDDFNKEIHRYYGRLRELYPMWNKLCANFPMTSLNPPEIRKLSNICDDTAKFMRKMFVVTQIYLKKLHSKPLEKSHPVKFMEIIFENLNSILNNETSAKNTKNCLSSLRLSILVNYRVMVNETIHIHKDFNTNRYTRYYSKFVLNFIDDVDSAIRKIKRCTMAEIIDTIECITPNLRYACSNYYNSIQNRRCNSIYSSISYFKEKHKIISEFFSKYYEKFDAINDLSIDAERIIREQFKLCND